MKKVAMCVLSVVIGLGMVVLSFSTVSAAQQWVMWHHVSQGHGPNDQDWTQCMPDDSINGHNGHAGDYQVSGPYTDNTCQTLVGADPTATTTTEADPTATDVVNDPTATTTTEADPTATETIESDPTATQQTSDPTVTPIVPGATPTDIVTNDGPGCYEMNSWQVSNPNKFNQDQWQQRWYNQGCDDKYPSGAGGFNGGLLLIGLVLMLVGGAGGIFALRKA